MEDQRVCAITAAMEDGTGLRPFAHKLPKRFFDVGIAEGHAAAMAAGMAKQGMIPVFAVYSSFLQRSYDMLIHDISLSDLHVVLAVDRAGLVGADGETHHGSFDALFLPQIPHMRVFCPASFAELRQMLRQALFDCDGPVAVRYPRGGEGRYRGVSQGVLAELRPGKDVTLASYGTLVNELLDAAEELERQGISARVVKINVIAPLSDVELTGAFGDGRPLLVLEDCIGCGCVGERIAAALTRQGCPPRKLMLRNLGSEIVPQGSVDKLLASRGLDSAGVVKTVMEGWQ